MACGYAAAQAMAAGPAGLARALPFALVIGYLGWRTFWHPRVTVTEAGVEVVNPLRTTEIPWPALIDVRTRYTCTFVTPRRSVGAFAAPGPGRHTATQVSWSDLRGRAPGTAAPDGSVAIGELPGSASAVVADHVRRRWATLAEAGGLALGTADETPVRVRVDGRALGVLGVLLAIGGLGQALV